MRQTRSRRPINQMLSTTTACTTPRPSSNTRHRSKLPSFPRWAAPRRPTPSALARPKIITNHTKKALLQRQRNRVRKCTPSRSFRWTSSKTRRSMAKTIQTYPRYTNKTSKYRVHQKTQQRSLRFQRRQEKPYP